ncbi:MAG: HAD family phosphatase [Verrucomicrobia bacterium]|nr:HAD family phosphatase [Verrucomicrobiota bacterium]
MKGWIALDIDGTLTLDKYSVPNEVTSYLKGLQNEGWRIALATGRTCFFASMALSTFDFPYDFLVQNGSAALQMPGKRLIFKKYISPRAIHSVEKALDGMDADFLVYSGYEKGDFCYWRPERFSKEHLDYVEKLQKREKETAKAIDSFEGLDPFPLIKCFGSFDQMTDAARRLRATGLFQVAQIRDVFTPGYQILLVTDLHASKGHSLRELMRIEGRGAKVIAAGDDENDLSLFDEADIKIAMAHSPEILLKRATLVAPPTSEMGIIAALEKVIR